MYNIFHCQGACQIWASRSKPHFIPPDTPLITYAHDPQLQPAGGVLSIIPPPFLLPYLPFLLSLLSTFLLALFPSCLLSLSFHGPQTLHALSPVWPLPEPDSPKPVRPADPLAVLASFWRPLGQLIEMFRRFGADRKKQVFGGIAPKRPKLVRLCGRQQY